VPRRNCLLRRPPRAAAPRQAALDEQRVPVDRPVESERTGRSRASRSPVTNAVVFGCPGWLPSDERLPRGARPKRRAAVVVAPRAPPPWVIAGVHLLQSALNTQKPTWKFDGVQPDRVPLGSAKAVARRGCASNRCATQRLGHKLPMGNWTRRRTRSQARAASARRRRGDLRFVGGFCRGAEVTPRRPAPRPPKPKTALLLEYVSRTNGLRENCPWATCAGQPAAACSAKARRQASRTASASVGSAISRISPLPRCRRAVSSSVPAGDR